MGNYISTAQRDELEAVKATNLQLRSDLDTTRKELLDSGNESRAITDTLRTGLEVSNARSVLVERNSQNTARELEQTTAELKALKIHCETVDEERDRAIARVDALQNEVTKLTSKTQNLDRKA